MYFTPDVALNDDARIGLELQSFAYAGLCAFVSVLPWGGDTITVGGLLLANWIILVPLGLAAVRLAVVKNVRRFCPIHALLLAFTAWAAASLLWTVDPESTVIRLGTYLQLLILVALVWELADTKERVQGLIVSYVLGAVIGSATTIYNFSIGETAAKQMGSGWETHRYSVDGINADDLGLMIALSVPMALYLLTANKNRWIKALCWVELIVGFTAILLTATRSALFAVIVGGVMMSGPALSRMTRTQKRIAVIACIALVVCAVLVVPQTSIDRYLSTATELTQGTLTHRTVIWAAGLEVFRDHPFLGVGAGAYPRAIVNIVGMPLVAHNTFISVLVEVGIVGVILLILLVVGMLYYALRMKYLEKRLWLALLAAWVIGVCAVTWEYRKITWLLFVLVAAHAYGKSTRGLPWRRERPSLVYKPRGQELRPSPTTVPVLTGSPTHPF